MELKNSYFFEKFMKKFQKVFTNLIDYDIMYI